MATPLQTPIPSSFSGKKRQFVERPIDLNSFFSSGFSNKPIFLLMSCTEEDKTLKSVSTHHFACNLQQQISEVQLVNRQREGSLLLEGRTDKQINKIVSLKCIAGHQVKVEVHPTLNLCKGVVTHDDFASESKED